MPSLSNRPPLPLGTPTRHGALVALLAGLLTVCLGCGARPTPSNWHGAWGTAPQDYNEPFLGPTPPLSFNNQTIRQVLRTSLGGKEVRVRFSNVFGKQPLQIDGASIARVQSGSSIAAGSATGLRFNGQPSVTIPPGEELWTDAAPLTVEAGSELAVSLFFASDTPVSTQHSMAMRDTYVVSGNALSADTLSNPETRPSYFFTTGLDVLNTAGPRVVVAFGDSITDGAGTTPGAERRWTDFLARRLEAQAKAGTVGVVNKGIGGGRILNDGIGPKGIDRFERDVLETSGVTHVVILLGINDIGMASFIPSQAVSVEQMTQGFQSMIDQAHAQGIKVLAATLLPFKGANPMGAPYYSEEMEPKRQAFNTWIRGNTSLDGVIDFDAALRDPADPLSLLPAYDSGDRLHPNDAGHEAMAKEVELRLNEARP
ncbi:SGNH/GDSL hydrolase family protein [Hyalangium gracile]|uniref:SGNH/GDSL hydrolase family protein n=1 Tax=Hyalangium gracile TaxID=394092 RepID=UPI001CCF3243|nr:SGNH/GDSL hydrolase family protein [Hyalangium gracile]